MHKYRVFTRFLSKFAKFYANRVVFASQIVTDKILCRRATINISNKEGTFMEARTFQKSKRADGVYGEPDAVRVRGEKRNVNKDTHRFVSDKSGQIDNIQNFEITK